MKALCIYTCFCGNASADGYFVYALISEVQAQRKPAYGGVYPAVAIGNFGGLIVKLERKKLVKVGLRGTCCGDGDTELSLCRFAEGLRAGSGAPHQEVIDGGVDSCLSRCLEDELFKQQRVCADASNGMKFRRNKSVIEKELPK